MGDILSQYFTEKNIRNTYREKHSHKRCKGFDKVSHDHFIANIDEEIYIIEKKCQAGSYRFTPYLECLKSKGRGKVPRVLSIPTVRDSVVLSILKDILHEVFTDRVNKKVANQYIRDISKYIHENDEIHYYKTDIVGFYDNIDRAALMSFLKTRIENTQLLNLIDRAINNVTLPLNAKKKQREQYKSDYGVPQGLSISNILAQIYLSDFDETIDRRKYFYQRYVDDIIILNSSEITTYRINNIERALQTINLTIHKPEKGENSKTDSGNLFENRITYLGYSINQGRISIAEKNIQNQINKIAAKITWYKKRIKDKDLRHKWLQDDKKFNTVFVNELNELISGAINNSKSYGWLFYFSEIEDIPLLYKMDTIVTNLTNSLYGYLSKMEIQKIKKFVRAYHEIRYNRDKSRYFVNYDHHDMDAKKREFLIQRGCIDPTVENSVENIISIYAKYRKERLKKLERGIAYRYF